MDDYVYRGTTTTISYGGIYCHDLERAAGDWVIYGGYYDHTYKSWENPEDWNITATGVLTVPETADLGHYDVIYWLPSLCNNGAGPDTGRTEQWFHFWVIEDSSSSSSSSNSSSSSSSSSSGSPPPSSSSSPSPSSSSSSVSSSSQSSSSPSSSSSSSSSKKCDPGPYLLVYTQCCSGECPPGAAVFVQTHCDSCPPGPAAKISTKKPALGPGMPLKFELDMP